MTCFKCAAELRGAKKFCSACGAPVQAAKPAIDPFASTIKPTTTSVPMPAPSEPGASSAPRSSNRVSPLASSSIEFSESVREIVMPHEDGAPVPVIPAPKSEKSLGGTVVMQQMPPRPATPAPAKASSVMPPSFGVSSSPNAALGPGMAVRVRWADGQKYPGTVWQLHGTQVLVSFQNGQRHWVEAGFVERA